MNKIFAPFLPPWAETGLQPAFYDVESGTVLQQTARMYDKVNQLTRLFNELSEETQETVDDYINRFTELYNYVHDYFDNLDVQEQIDHKLDEMVDDGTMQELINNLLEPNVIWTFDTVADMQDYENFSVGCFAKTLGFNTINDGGGAFYKIKDATGVTTNNYDKLAIGDTLYAELSVDGSVYPEQFGCVGDGTTDDSNAFQACVDFAHANDVAVNLNEKTYLLNSGVTIYTKININGNNGTLKSTADAPILKSTSPISSVRLNDINFIGANDVTKTANIGLDIVPFYSEFKNLNFTNLYYAVYLKTTGADGTLVENRFADINVRSCFGGLKLGDADNNKLTDGFLNNVVIYTSDSSLYGVYIGSCAGWNINEVHVYGTNSTAIYVKNGWRTNLSNIYIESTSTNGLYVDSMQLGVSLTNAHVSVKTDTEIAVKQRSSSYQPLGTNSVFNVANLITVAPDTSTANIVDVDKINIVNYTHYGGGTKLVVDKIADSNIVDSISIKNKKLSDDNTYKRLSYNDSIVNLMGTDVLNAAADTEKVITIPLGIAPPYSYSSCIYKFKMMTYQYWDSSSTCNYEADVAVINKGGSYSVKSSTSSSTSMFTNAPVFTYSSGNLVITFTPNTTLQGSYRLY